MTIDGAFNLSVRREKELASVVVNQSDVEMIAGEMDMDKPAAERALREHKGDIQATLNTLVSS